MTRVLRVAEEAVERLRLKPEPEAVNNLRKNIVSALREGIIDSKEDVDSDPPGQRNGWHLLTADTGRVKWADKVGIRSLIPACCGASCSR